MLQKNVIQAVLIYLPGWTHLPLYDQHLGTQIESDYASRIHAPLCFLACIVWLFLANSERIYNEERNDPTF